MPAVSEAVPDTTPPQSGGRSFVSNVLWNWVGAIANIAAGLFLQPYIIRQLGSTRYGIWALVFSTLDYLRMFDLGFRAAIVNYTARYRARDDYSSLNRMLSSAAVYFGSLGLGICVFVVFFSARFPALFKVPAEYAADSVFLARVVGVSVAIGLFSALFSGMLEAFQRFDLLNRAYVSVMMIRMAGSILLLYLGYGLVELGLLYLATQLAERLWNIRNVLQLVPQLRLRIGEASTQTLRSMFGYSFSSFLLNNAMLAGNQAPLVMIGYMSSAASVGFFSLPFRLVNYAGDVIPRVGSVTTSKIAELDERNAKSVKQFTEVINRYCYTLFLPLTVFFLVYGYPLLARLVAADFAARSAPVLPLIAIVVAVTTAGMFNTQATLVGQARHRIYAYGLTLEVICLVGALAWSIPRYGIVGAAWSILTVMTFSRGLVPAALFCRYNECSLAKFLWFIYAGPTFTAIPVALLAFILRGSLLPGRNWPELIAAGAVIATVFLAAAFYTCVLPEHRRHAIHLISARLRRFI